MRALRLSLLCIAGLALAGLALPQEAPAQPAQCGRTATGASAAATTQLVAGVQGQSIHLCGWDVTATAAATFQLVAGSGATCGTGTVNVTGAHALSTNNVFTSSGATPGRYSTPNVVAPATPLNVCIIVTGTGPVQWTVFYTQF